MLDQNLIKAVSTNNREKVDELLNTGADPDIALHLATDPYILKQLIIAGANTKGLTFKVRDNPELLKIVLPWVDTD